MATMTAAEKRVAELEALKSQLATTPAEEQEALNVQIAELEKKVEADKAKATKKTVNLDKAFKESYKTFAVGIQAAMRQAIREK